MNTAGTQRRRDLETLKGVATTYVSGDDLVVVFEKLADSVIVSHVQTMLESRGRLTTWQSKPALFFEGWLA